MFSATVIIITGVMNNNYYCVGNFRLCRRIHLAPLRAYTLTRAHLPPLRAHTFHPYARGCDRLYTYRSDLACVVLTHGVKYMYECCTCVYCGLTWRWRLMKGRAISGGGGGDRRRKSSYVASTELVRCIRDGG